jgi:hypothetical protein
MRFAVLVLGFAFSGAAWAADSDGDGVEDDVDACPMDDATGHDLYVDGCVDTLDDYEPYLESLGLDPGCRGRARRIRASSGPCDGGRARLRVHREPARKPGRRPRARRRPRDDARQLRAINDFVRALVAM